jgi:tetratricopeptide (TPR) repeat protein
MAMIETDRGNGALSDEYYGRSIEFGSKSSSKSYIANSYANQGIRKFSSSDYDSSLYFFEKSLELRLELNNTRQVLEGYYNLGYYYVALDSVNRSIEYFETGRALAEKHELWTDLNDFLDELIAIYEAEDKSSIAQDYKNRKEEVAKIVEQKNSKDESLMAGIDLDFDGNDNNSVSVNDAGGINWMLFVIIVLAALVALFLLLERKRFS